MAVTKEAEIEFAKLVLDHRAKDAIIERVTLKLMRSFQRGSPEIREEAVKALDSMEMFFHELQYIIAAEAELN